ncbi:MAG: PilZ domain-containing protein [Labilithrix sp.]|nr:PilZ domain-containing protein [Labilithrix sp.]
MHSVQPLGRLLVTSGLLTQQALDEVLSLQRSDGRRLGELLAERGLVRPHQLAQFLSHQLACPWVSLQRVEISREAVAVLPRSIALAHHMVPVHLRTTKGATTLYVAMDDPTDDVALAAAAAAAAMPVKAMVALTSEIREHLEQLYGTSVPAATPGPPPVREPSPSSASISAPAISVKDASSSARDPSTTSTPSRSPKPPPPRPSGAPPAREEQSLLDVIEVLEEDPSSRPPRPKVLVVDANEELLVRVRAAAARFGGDALGVPLAEVASAVAANAPSAVVVTEEVYANERSGLDRLVLEAGALLLVASEAFEAHQLEGLLADALERWRRSSYEKGTVLEGRYELLRDLGGRLAGSRWEVRHLRTARRSLLKIGVRVASDESDSEAVRREQLALASFNHPGSVDLRDAGTTESGDPYIVVEMLEGRTLEGLVAARGALPLAAACSLIRQIADVLVAAHESCVRHGEVRPDNVLVVRDAWGVERAKLVNWEAANLVEGAPDTAIDLAGIGACAFLALAGRTRHEGEDVRSIRSGSWAPQELPPTLAAVIARTLAGAGADRFTSARELIEALDAAAPPAPASMRLLDASPERRGKSIRPLRRSVAPPPEAEKVPPPPPSPAPSEMRRYPRAAYRTPVRVEVPGIGAVDGRSEDISEGGLFVVTRGKIADGAQVTVRFALPIDGKVVSESGVVRWSKAPHSGDGGVARAIGIELTSPGPESIKQISRYVSFMAAEK